MPFRIFALSVLFWSRLLVADVTEEDWRKVLTAKVVAEGNRRLRVTKFEALTLIEKLVSKRDGTRRGCEFDAELEVLEDARMEPDPIGVLTNLTTMRLEVAEPAGSDPSNFPRMNNPNLRTFTHGSRIHLVGWLFSTLRSNEWQAPTLEARIIDPTPEEIAAAKPPLDRAGQVQQCLRNLKEVGLAVRIYSLDNSGKMPDGFLSITNEITNPSKVICPSDASRADILPMTIPQRWTEIAKRGSSYTLDWAGKDSAEKAGGDVMIKCSVHGNICTFDGNVQERLPNGSMGPPQ